MRSIAIINQKGGVGKTTSAVNLSAALAEDGHRVWLIDLDPQAHASLHYGVALDGEQASIYNVLIDDVPIEKARHQVCENLWLSPSHIDLAASEMELAGEVGREIILRDRLNDDQRQFDFVLIDCPPSLGVLTLNALTTAQEVFLPMQPHFLALHGLSKLLRTIELVAKRLNKGLQLSGVMFCMCDNQTRLANEVIGDVQEFFRNEDNNPAWAETRCFDTRIRRNVRLAEAPSYGQSIFEYSPNSNGANDYRSLAAEVYEMGLNLSQSASEAVTDRDAQTVV